MWSSVHSPANPGLSSNSMLSKVCLICELPVNKEGTAMMSLAYVPAWGQGSQPVHQMGHMPCRGPLQTLSQI
jgi:hypothetical protein